MSETQNKELAKSYDPASIEAKWYPFWEQQGYFKAGLEEGKPSFSIQLPPPNITGILHMGHAFNHSVMDSLTRFYRMNGYNTEIEYQREQDAWYGSIEHIADM